MYNFYTHHKKLKELEDENKRRINDEKRSKEKKVLQNKLVENYDTRIKDFIIDMVKSPIILTKEDNTRKYETTRETYMKELLQNSKSVQNFKLKKFQTEKQRVTEYLRSKSKENIHLDDQASFNRDLLASGDFIQPAMRFKPRSDFERIYDSVLVNNFGKIKQELLFEHLHDLQSTKVKVKNENIPDLKHKANKIKSGDVEDHSPSYINKNVVRSNKNHASNLNDSIESSENLTDRSKKKTKIKFQIKHDTVPAYKKKRKYIDNSLSKLLLSDLHNKTHFKAATTISMKISPSVKSVFPNKPEKLKVDLKSNTHHHKNSHSLFNFTKSSNLTNSSSVPNIFSNNSGPKILKDFKINFNLNNIDPDIDIQGYNSILVDKLNSPVKNKEKLEVDENALKYLKKLSEAPQGFEVRKRPNFIDILKTRRNAKSVISKDIKEFFINYKGGPLIQEDANKNEEYYRFGTKILFKSQINEISEEILKKCNYTSAKSKFNQTVLRKGEGKTMITDGLTLNQFKKRFHIQI